MLTERIFNAISEEGHATTRDIVDKHLYPEYKTNQISTILKRLYDRGFLDREDVSDWENEERYEYWVTEKGKEISDYKKVTMVNALKITVLNYFDEEGIFD